MNKPSVLDVTLHREVIGTLTRLPDDRNVFAFTERYINDSRRPTLSLSFKSASGDLIRELPPTQTRLPHFFANLLPEGAMRDYLARRARIKAIREFYLLWVLGRDLPGALEIHPQDKAEPFDLPDTETPTASATEQPPLRFSLAGVQLKFSAVQEANGGLTIRADGTGGSWIVKLPSTRFAGVPENEFAMLELARSVGIDVPETALIPVKDIQGLPSGIETVGDVAFGVRRFDRTANGETVHMEDFAQVFRVYPEAKYDKATYRNIAEVLWVETGQDGIAEFLRRIVFTALIGNADMHLKNWSLIYPDRRQAKLSPAYDFVSTIAYLPEDELPLGFAGSKKFESLTEEQFVRFAAKAGLPQKLTLDVLHETVAAFAEKWRGKANLGIDAKLRKAINAHLKRVPIYSGRSPK